eukprot:gnl/MRDRNA2_/MRDRNA2_203126_c0_seq1.p1 gnl/MRDRNA2_/MRDRNA2_203126_c0~~gnl/MRDRNA2_/MRDRNA2_203126_c0_seq1.p1  ORF type:complete len:319 (+),score=52.53 gnl/MRDRNA2_/MRDRNA2_203126_c0_seq1:87-959(+)
MPQAERREIHDDVTVCVFFLQFPELWRERVGLLSVELQKVCDAVVRQGRLSEIQYNERLEQRLEFSVCIADPSLADCPLVAVSKGFEKLTGYRVEDAIGRNCRFLSYGVPSDLYDEDTTTRLRKFTDLAISGDPFADFADDADRIVDDDVDDEATLGYPDWLPEELRTVGGASFFLRWNRRRDGRLFKNLFVLRQVWVGDRTYIVALQTEVQADPGDQEQHLEPSLPKKVLFELSRMADVVSHRITQDLPSLTNTQQTKETEKKSFRKFNRKATGYDKAEVTYSKRKQQA